MFSYFIDGCMTLRLLPVGRVKKGFFNNPYNYNLFTK